jgi:hypothetical protein
MERRTLVAKWSCRDGEANLGSKECPSGGAARVNGWEGDATQARLEGKFTAGQTNTWSARWDQMAMSARVCVRTSRCIK